MKVFKTILRTTLFWLLALVGLRIYTSYESENSNLVHYRASALPESVIQHLHNQYNCSCPNCDTATGNNETATTDETPTTDLAASIPATCKSFYDGCNTCNRLADGGTACTRMACESYGQPKCLDEETTTGTTTSLLPTASQPTTTEGISSLEKRIAELEKNHWALVQELQTIFSTPEGQKLLPAPTPVANPAAQN